MRVLPLASTGTVVSSAWMRSAAKTCARIASTSGISVAAAAPDPVGQRRDVELDAFAGIDGALAVERQMQAVLGEQDMGEQLGAGAPARDRMRGRRRLGDRLAGAAGELLAHVLDHLPLARNELQRLGHVLADLAQGAAAAARAGQGRRIDDALARQMLGQRPARRLAPLERRHRDLLARRRCRQPRRGLGLRGILFQVGELQLELLEQRAAFRGLAEPLVPQLGDRELELLDQQRAVLRLALRRGRSRLCRTQCLALRHDQRMRTREIGRQRIIECSSPTMESQHAALCLSRRISVWIQNAAISRPLAAATCAAASASRCLPANSQAAPA